MKNISRAETAFMVDKGHFQGVKVLHLTFNVVFKSSLFLLPCRRENSTLLDQICSFQIMKLEVSIACPPVYLFSNLTPLRWPHLPFLSGR